MKRILCIVLSLMLALSIAACANQQPATLPAEAPQIEEPKEDAAAAPDAAAPSADAPSADTPSAEVNIKVEAATEEQVEAFLNDSDEKTILVDARPQEAYAGWALEGAANGGHLKDAILYSARWLDFKMNDEKRATRLTAYNDAINLSSENSYIIYDYNGTKNAAANVAKYFKTQGIENVTVFNAKDIIDAGENIVKYTNYDRYIPAEIVKTISDYKSGATDALNTAVTEAAGITEDNIDKVVLIDVSYGNVHESVYLTDGHVPGAIHLNTNAYERPRSYTPEKRENFSIEYRLIPIAEFRDSLCPEYGIDKDSIVIAISTDARPLARFGFMLRSLGVKYYAMSANMNAWIYNGYRLDTENIVKPTSVKSFGSDKIAYPDEIVWMDQAKRILAGQEEGTLVGGDNFSTYSYHDLMGTIQGIVSDGSIITENVDNTPPMKEIFLQGYKNAGIATDKLIVPFCGDGWAASRTAYNAQSVDLDNVKYWGEGWVVWSNTGNEFITYDGKLVRYDKYIDAVIDKDGNIIADENVMKVE
ncbi:MAG: rhodanese-like domain-containing protein [Christensenellaceae bacterium]|jgi:thiosulfate/3-mercaptopyruvate sulfurtransferase|nr:rhodanese-like domain-containing protein [Christensenellaceae bacterium]